MIKRLWENIHKVSKRVGALTRVVKGWWNGDKRPAEKKAGKRR